jgi:hypothetical protein
MRDRNDRVKKTLLGGVLLLLLAVALAHVYAVHHPRAALAGTASNTTAAFTEQARSAFDFINSVGVNTHLNYFDRTYGNFSLVERELRSVGIRHLRDGAHLQNDDYNKFLYGRWAELGKSGIRFDVVLDPRSNLGPLTTALLEQIDQLSGHTIESFEGPNELDVSNMPDWPALDRSYQQEISGAAHSLPDAAQIRLIGPSLAFVAHGEAFAGPLDGFDEGNLHPYPAGKMPSVIFPEQIDLAQQAFGKKPIVITESGYHNALNDHSDQPGVSEPAAARYIPRLFLENFSRGIVRTYLYEFLDEAPDPGLSNNQLHWGLIRADGTEKPAFTALRRLMDELNDGAEPASPTQFSWSLDTTNPAIHHLLLQKSDGEIDLILWQEVRSFDVRSQKDIENPPVNTVLSLPSQAQSVALYEPTGQAEPIKTYTSTSTVPLSVPDAPLVIAIKLGPPH